MPRRADQRGTMWGSGLGVPGRGAGVAGSTARNAHHALEHGWKDEAPRSWDAAGRPAPSQKLLTRTQRRGGGARALVRAGWQRMRRGGATGGAAW